MHRDRVKHPLHLGAADLALGHRIVADPLHDLELMALLAPVLVNRHRFREYSWHSRRQSAKRGPWAGPRRGSAAGGGGGDGRRRPPGGCHRRPPPMPDDAVTMEKIVSL